VWHGLSGAHYLQLSNSKEISMNTLVRTILAGGIVSLCLTTSLIAQPGTTQYDQWYRAKYGRPVAATQARTNTPQINPAAAPEAAQQTVPGTGFEHWYRAKYGRPSPTEQVPASSRQVMSAESMPPMVMPMEASLKDVAANTPAEHARIAQTYRNQAQAYLAQARQHQAMIASYKASPNLTSKNQAATISHCEYFAARFNELAAKSQELAELHDQMAKQAAQN
jgi:hypothetical protein